MLSKRPSRALAVFSLVFLAAILALFAWDLAGRYRSAIAEAKQSARNFADVLGEHTARTLEGVDRALHEAESIREDALAGRYDSHDSVTTRCAI